MYFVFQPSKIWDGYNSVDVTQPLKRVKAKNEDKARRRLPPLPIGRTWILVSIIDKN